MSKRKLTYKDFKQYFSNNLPNKDKHAFEKDMMQDAFEEEAFNGLSKLNEEELENDIIELKSTIQKQTRRRRKLIPVWYRYAASVVILVGIGLSIFFLGSRFWQDSMLIKQFSEELEIMDSMLIEVELEFEKIANQSEKDTSKELAKDVIAKNTKDVPKEDIIVVEDNVEIEDELILNDSETENDHSFAMEIAEDNEVFDDEMIAKEEVVSEELLYAETKTISNNIIEAENVNELALGKSLEVTNQKSAQPMAVRAKKSSNEAIIKNEDTSTIELIITEAKPPSHIEEGQLDIYIIERIDYNLFSSYVGRHTITFTFIVETSGKLSDFKFTRSPNIIFNDEIIRVMTDAGKWIPATEDNQDVNSFVRFTLKIEVK